MVLIGRVAREAFRRFCCIPICGAEGRVSGATPRREVTLEEQWMIGAARVLFNLVGCHLDGIVGCFVFGAARRG